MLDTLDRGELLSAKLDRLGSIESSNFDVGLQRFKLMAVA
jgi:hypothetical protein